MNRSAVRISLFITAACATVPAASVDPARACSFAPLEDHTVDPEEEAVDTTPPGAPVFGGAQITRRPRLPGCSDDGLCDGSGSIALAFTAPVDDRTPAAEMGYLVELAGGEMPAGLGLPDGPVRLDDDGKIVLVFSDQDQPLDFSLSVRAVDLAGNPSQPASIALDSSGNVGCPDDGRPQPGDGEGGGCSAAQSSPGMLVLVLLAVAVMLRRRRGAI